MAEDVNYASVVFKNKNRSRPEARNEEETVYDEVKVNNNSPEQSPDTNAKNKEETVYDEVKVKKNSTEQSPDTNDKKADGRRRHYRLLACCLATFCVILLLGIIAICVYIATFSQENNINTLLEMNHNLTNLNNNLREDNTNLTVQFDNLTQASAVLESKVTNLTAEKMNLEKQNQKLETQNQELEMEKRNLTNQIKDMEAKGNELNISRAQWSIDAYCPRKDGGGRHCKSCQPGWNLFQSSCYVVLDYKTSTDRKTWEEAREHCKIRSSDLVVVDNAEEKTYVSGKSWKSSGNKGYWIGLKADGGKWKWVDGSDLADSSWIENPTDGHCAISVWKEGWKSVNCTNRNNWICEQKALSV
ncbi:asialoglycoprotein receptor 1-like isoform X2 [Brachyistius frenatus]|uniref:asialoglycoprotein receptor 1-like isoform X2 n=1 Tax=Brachyistius frenatus TaxID=100188 RepID=UPI0037E8C698